MKKAWFMFLVCLIIATVIKDMPMWLLPMKYCGLAYVIMLGASLLMNYLSIPKFQVRMLKTCSIWCSLLIMIVFTILVIDTFWFHALTWFPGLIRYPIIDAYGVCYSVFVVPGILWYLGTPTRRKVNGDAKV